MVIEYEIFIVIFIVKNNIFQSQLYFILKIASCIHFSVYKFSRESCRCEIPFEIERKRCSKRCSSRNTRRLFFWTNDEAARDWLTAQLPRNEHTGTREQRHTVGLDLDNTLTSTVRFKMHTEPSPVLRGVSLKFRANHADRVKETERERERERKWKFNLIIFALAASNRRIWCDTKGISRSSNEIPRAFSGHRINPFEADIFPLPLPPRPKNDRRPSEKRPRWNILLEHGGLRKRGWRGERRESRQSLSRKRSIV